MIMYNLANDNYETPLDYVNGNIRRCPSCLGTRQIQGLGLIPKPCPYCDAKGFQYTEKLKGLIPTSNLNSLIDESTGDSLTLVGQTPGDLMQLASQETIKHIKSIRKQKDNLKNVP